MRFITVSVVLIMCLFLAACERGTRTTRAAPDSEGIADRDRQIYEDRVDARLKEFEHRFDGLEARLKGLDPADQEHLRLDIAELHARKDMLKEKLSDLHKVSDQSWLDVRASLDRELDQLEVAYNLVSANNHSRDHKPLKSEGEQR